MAKGAATSAYGPTLSSLGSVQAATRILWSLMAAAELLQSPQSRNSTVPWQRPHRSCRYGATSTDAIL